MSGSIAGIANQCRKYCPLLNCIDYPHQIKVIAHIIDCNALRLNFVAFFKSRLIPVYSLFSETYTTFLYHMVFVGVLRDLPWYDEALNGILILMLSNKASDWSMLHYEL